MLDFRVDVMFFREQAAANVAMSLAIVGAFIWLRRTSSEDRERYRQGSGDLFSKPFEVNAYGTTDAAIEAIAMRDTLAALVGYD